MHGGLHAAPKDRSGASHRSLCFEFLVVGPSSLRLLLAFNPHSGPESVSSADAILSAMVAKGTGFEPVRIKNLAEGEIEPEDLEGIDVVVLWGGDGTLSRFLHRHGDAKPLAPLPGGTMNKLYRQWIGEPADWCDSFRQSLEKNVQTLVRAGSANGTPFFFAAAFGQLTRLAEAREAIRHGNVVAAVSGLIEQPVFDFDHKLRLLSNDGEPIGSPAPAIGCVLEGVGEQRIAIGALNVDNLADLGSAAIAASLNDWKETDRIEVGRGTAFALETAGYLGRSVPCMIDGEPMEMDLPISIRIVENAGRILCPKR